MVRILLRIGSKKVAGGVSDPEYKESCFHSDPGVRHYQSAPALRNRPHEWAASSLSGSDILVYRGGLQGLGVFGASFSLRASCGKDLAYKVQEKVACGVSDSDPEQLGVLFS